jgi:hypothetical protein
MAEFQYSVAVYIYGLYYKTPSLKCLFLDLGNNGLFYKNSPLYPNLR